MIQNMLYWLISQLAAFVLGSGVLERVVGAVERWAAKKFADGMPAQDQNAERRHGVMDEILNWGIDPQDPCPPLGESLRRLAVELAYQLFKRNASGSDTDIPVSSDTQTSGTSVS